MNRLNNFMSQWLVSDFITSNFQISEIVKFLLFKTSVRYLLTLKIEPPLGGGEGISFFHSVKSNSFGSDVGDENCHRLKIITDIYVFVGIIY